MPPPSRNVEAERGEHDVRDPVGHLVLRKPDIGADQVVHPLEHHQAGHRGSSACSCCLPAAWAAAVIPVVIASAMLKNSRSPSPNTSSGTRSAWLRMRITVACAA